MRSSREFHSAAVLFAASLISIPACSADLLERDCGAAKVGWRIVAMQ
jgi:hypothetical protein